MAHKENLAIDGDGRVLPHSPEEVEQIVKRAIDGGELVAAILRMDGHLCVQVMGPPSAELAEALDTVAHAYRQLMKGH